MKKVRWGIIGCGGIARSRTIPGMMLTENAELVSVMDLDIKVAEAVKEQFGALKAYNNAEDVVNNDDIDAVYIATPVFTHAPLTKMAADHGKHVLCEKPLGLNADEALEVVEYCKAKGVLLSVDLMMRYGTHINNIKKAIADGDIGQVVSGDSRFSCWVPNAGWSTNKERAGGGPLMDMGIHLIDLMRYITGMDVTHVIALNENISFHDPKYTVEDSSTITMRMENGAQFVVFTHFNIPDTAGKWTLNLYGTKGRLLGDKIIGQIDEGSLWELALVDGVDDFFMEPVEGNKIGKEIKADFSNMYTHNLTDFGDAILNGTKNYIDPMECVKDQWVIDASYKSSEEGRLVEVRRA